MNSKGTQLYIYVYAFSPKLPSHPVCYITVSRIQQTGVFKYPHGVTNFPSCCSRQEVQSWLAQAEWWVQSLDHHFDFSQKWPKMASTWSSMGQDVLWVRLGLGPSRRPFTPLSSSAPLVSPGLRTPGPEGHSTTFLIWSKKDMSFNVVRKVNKSISLFLSLFASSPFFSLQRLQLCAGGSACYLCWGLYEIPLHDWPHRHPCTEWVTEEGAPHHGAACLPQMAETPRHFPHLNVLWRK